MKNLRNSMGASSGSAFIRDGANTYKRLLFLGLCWALAVPTLSNAAPIGLQAQPGSPDIVTTGAYVKYDYTGTGGVLTIDKLNALGVIQSVLTVDEWEYNGNPVDDSLVIRKSPANTSLFTNYKLVANFDASGNFVAAGSTVEVTGVIDADAASGVQILDQFNPALPSSKCYLLTCGTNGLGAGGANLLLKGNLLGFGFVGNPADDAAHDSLLLEFYMEVVGGDFATVGYDSSGIRPDVGVIASGLVSYNTLSPTTSGQYGGVNWDDDLGTGNPYNAFKKDFISCNNCTLLVDTFVPVPAAVWLFSSGLVGLIGVGARKRRERNRLRRLV